MRWLDVMGPPAVGKSSLCDPLWPPHAIDWKSDQISMPEGWKPYLKLVIEYLKKVESHPTYEACKGMTARSIRKMAAVSQSQNDHVYTQTGLAQRGLGFGWRLDDPEEIREYFEAMPVSLGCVSLQAPPDVLKSRNKARESFEETKHENRSFMIDPMIRPQEIAVEVLGKRCPLLQIDMTQPIEESRKLLHDFGLSLAGTKQAIQQEPAGFNYQEALVSAFLEF